MNAKLSEAIEAVSGLSEERQAKIAQDMLDAAYEAKVDEEIEKGIASYRRHGGIPAEKVFDRLIEKYGG